MKHQIILVISNEKAKRNIDVITSPFKLFGDTYTYLIFIYVYIYKFIIHNLYIILYIYIYVYISAYLYIHFINIHKFLNVNLYIYEFLWVIVFYSNGVFRFNVLHIWVSDNRLKFLIFPMKLYLKLLTFISLFSLKDHENYFFSNFSFWKVSYFLKLKSHLPRELVLF